MIKVQGSDTYCYSHEEVRAVVGMCRNRVELQWLRDVVVALATTGLRIGELVELRWANVDLDGGTLRLRDTSRQARNSERAGAQTTNSRRDRTLTIHSDFSAVLRRVPRHADQRAFHGPLGGKLKADTVRNVLKREVLAELADRFPGVDGRTGIEAGRVHSFRHYFASRAANSGVAEQVLMDWPGHRKSLTIRHYYHLRQDEARRQMLKISSLVESGPGPDGPGPDSGAK